MAARPAAGGGRWVDVAPERLTRWLENFATRHGDYTADGLVPPTNFAEVFGKMPLCFWILQLHDSQFVPVSTEPTCGVLLKDYHP